MQINENRIQNMESVMITIIFKNTEYWLVFVRTRYIASIQWQRHVFEYLAFYHIDEDGNDAVQGVCVLRQSQVKVFNQMFWWTGLQKTWDNSVLFIFQI